MPRTKNKTYDEQRISRIRRYGIDVPDYNRILEEQGGGCYICGKKPEPKRALDIDHNHATGNVRGLLCSIHNRGIGFFEDNPILLLKAIEYLIKDRNDK